MRNRVTNEHTRLMHSFPLQPSVFSKSLFFKAAQVRAPPTPFHYAMLYICITVKFIFNGLYFILRSLDNLDNFLNFYKVQYLLYTVLWILTNALNHISATTVMDVLKNSFITLKCLIQSLFSQSLLSNHWQQRSIFWPHSFLFLQNVT